MFIYVCVKKLTICCWTSLYPWLHPCCCRCCFFLLFFRLFAPRRRSLLGLVLLNPPSPFSSTVPVPCCFLLIAAASKAWSYLLIDSCFGSTINSLALSLLLSLSSFYIFDVWIDIQHDNGIYLVLKV